ncbi:MAG: hypothetical protein GX811_07225, partial [Lentisphaerae bacterium]|nr:hypothetical protein [Lentisphaerota bacterium]
MSKSTKIFSSFLILITAFLLVAGAEEKPQPSFQTVFTELTKKIRQSKGDEREEALQALLKLEKETESPDDLCSIYEIQMQYDKDKHVYAQKIIDSGGANDKQKTLAYTALVAKCDYSARFMGYYMSETIDKQDVASMEREEIRLREELVKLNSNSVGSLNNLGCANVEASNGDKAEKSFLKVLAIHEDACRK